MDLRPSVVNALVPELLGKVIVPGGIITVIGIVLASITPDSIPILASLKAIVSGFGFYLIVWGVLLIPFVWTIIMLSRTVYRFGSVSVTREFSLISVRRLTVPYDKIVHLKTRISLWDRISGAGDIIIHTAENNAPDLTLRFIPKPQKVEEWLIAKMK